MTLSRGDICWINTAEAEGSSCTGRSEHPKNSFQPGLSSLGKIRDYQEQVNQGNARLVMPHTAGERKEGNWGDAGTEDGNSPHVVWWAQATQILHCSYSSLYSHSEHSLSFSSPLKTCITNQYFPAVSLLPFLRNFCTHQGFFFGGCNKRSIFYTPRNPKCHQHFTS